MTLLTYHSKYVVQSSTSVSTTGTSLVDDTQASQTFTLDSTKTVLAIYIAVGTQSTIVDYMGIKNAIQVDGSDRSLVSASLSELSLYIRNACFWVGTLGSGTHTIKGRIAGVSSSSVSITNRTLLIYIFNGDEFSYIDNSTSQSTSSSIYTDDSYANSTFTPSSSCKALCIYSVCGYQSVGGYQPGIKTCIKVGTTDYTACEAQQSPGWWSSSNKTSLATAYALSLSTQETTVKGRFSLPSGSNSITISNSILCVLLLDSTTVLDIVNSTTSISTTSVNFSDDQYASTTRETEGELLCVACATKRDGTTSSKYGTAYRLMVDSTDYTLSRSSPSYSGVTYAESNCIAYAQTISSGSCTIKGRIASNTAAYTAAVDTRILIALWFPTSSPVTTLDCSSTISGSGTSTASPSTLTITPCSSSIQGSGSFTANNLLYKLLTSSISGSGSSTASNLLYKLLSSSISGSGSSTANGIVITYIPLTSTVSGSGSESANLLTYKQISSSVSGSGDSTVNANLQQILSSILSGSGSETASIIIFNYLTSSVSGSGSESATATVINQGSVSCSSILSGSGSQSSSVVVYDFINSTVAGSGSESANASLQKILSSTLSGSGSATATLMVYDFISSTQTGSGSQTANAILYKLLSSSVSGSGSETGNATVLNYGSGVECSSFISGSGSQSANSILYELLNSSVSGSGSESATIHIIKPISSTVSGSGSQESLVSLQKIIQSLLQGTGIQSASVITYEQLSSVLAGSGEASAIHTLYNYISSESLGNGSQTATISLQELVSSIVSGSGNYSADVTVITITHKDFKYPLTAIINKKTRTVTIIKHNRTVTFN